MTQWRDDRIGAALGGTNPTVLSRMPSGFAVFGDVQWLPGYCVLLVDDPAITRLSELDPSRRSDYLESVATLAAAVEQACAEADPDFLRVNIEILGNTDPYLHAHIWPRYGWEDEWIRRRPVWLYPAEHWSNPAHAASADHDALRSSIRRRLPSGV